MEIICPECQFTREVDETKIPARSQVATCPKCQTKFKFRELPDEPEAAQEQPTPQPAPTPEPEQTEAPEPSPASSETPEAPAEPQLPITNDGQKGLWDTLDEMAPPQASDKETKPESKDSGAADNEPEPMAAEPESPSSAPAEPDYEVPEKGMPDHEHSARPQEPEQQPIPGWTGEFNSDFPDPFEAEDKADEEEESPMVPPPFEQLDQYGFFRGLVLTVKLILTSPRLFFSVMPVGGGLSKPLTFTILLTMVQGFVQYFWGMAGLSVSVGTESAEPVAGVSGALAPILMLLFMPAFIAAGQFIVTGVYHLLLILARADKRGFEGTFRALAYANAPIILGIFPMPIPEIEIGWMAIVAVWGLFLTVTGLKHIHQVSYAKIVPVALVPLLLAIIGGVLVFQSQLPTI